MKNTKNNRHWPETKQADDDVPRKDNWERSKFSRCHANVDTTKATLTEPKENK